MSQEIEKENWKYFELNNKNQHIRIRTKLMLDGALVVLRGKVIALNVYVRKEKERSKMLDLGSYLHNLGNCLAVVTIRRIGCTMVTKPQDLIGFIHQSWFFAPTFCPMGIEFLLILDTQVPWLVGSSTAHVLLYSKGGKRYQIMNCPSKLPPGGDTFYWGKQVLWPHLTSKRKGRCNPIVNLEGREMEYLWITQEILHGRWQIKHKTAWKHMNESCSGWSSDGGARNPPWRHPQGSPRAL